MSETMPTVGPYRADFMHKSLEHVTTRFNVVGPHIAGGWHGTVPQSHDGMKQNDAHHLAALLNLAYEAGQMDIQRAVRVILGLPPS